MGNACTTVGCIDKGSTKVGFSRTAGTRIEYLTYHHLYTTSTIFTTGNTGNTDTIAISGTYSTCHMCTVRVGIDVGRVDNKVVTIYVINKSITIIINTRLTVKLGLINPKVVLKVWMVYLETTVNNSYDNILRACNACLPCLEEVDVIAGNTALYASIVVVMPLVGQQWVVERHC